MVHISITDDIIFVEGSLQNVKVIGSIVYERGYFNQQLKNLDNVKRQLASKAKMAGGNIVINFTYGQKAAKWYQFSHDSTDWFGSGMAGTIDTIYYQELVQSIMAR